MRAYGVRITGGQIRAYPFPLQPPSTFFLALRTVCTPRQSFPDSQFPAFPLHTIKSLSVKGIKLSESLIASGSAISFILFRSASFHVRSSGSAKAAYAQFTNHQLQFRTTEVLAFLTLAWTPTNNVKSN